MTAALIDRESEAALLGAALLSGEASLTVAEMDGHAFGVPAHKHIAAAITALVERCVTPDAVVLATELGDLLDEVGGLPALLEMTANTPTVSNARRYRARVDELAARRTVAHLAHEIGKAAVAGDNISALVDSLAAASTARSSFARSVPIRDIQVEHVRWLVPGFIPIGAATLMTGRGGQGKSLVTCDLVGRLSRGESWPGFKPPRQPLASLILCGPGEDPPWMWKARYEVMHGIDISGLVHVSDSLTGEPLYLPGDIAALRAEIKRLGVGLVVIDSMAAVSPGLDLDKGPDARRFMGPLGDLAAETGTAIVVIAHLRKGSAGATAAEQIAGSAQLVNAARSVLMVGPMDRDDPDGVRVVVPSKGNWSGRQSARTFEISERLRVDALGAPVLDDDGETIGLPFVRWGEAADVTADDVMLDGGAERRNASDEARAWLADALSDGIWHDSAVLKEEASTKRYIPNRTLQRAFKDGGYESDRRGFGKDSRTFWRLPDPSVAPRIISHASHATPATVAQLADLGATGSTQETAVQLPWSDEERS